MVGMKLRFSIRDLMWLLLVAGVGLAWWADRQYMVVRCDQMQQQVDEYSRMYNRAWEQHLEARAWAQKLSKKLESLGQPTYPD